MEFVFCPLRSSTFGSEVEVRSKASSIIMESMPVLFKSTLATTDSEGSLLTQTTLILVISMDQ